MAADQTTFIKQLEEEIARLIAKLKELEKLVKSLKEIRAKL